MGFSLKNFEVKDPNKRASYSLIAALVVSALAGVPYAYGAFNPAIKSALNYPQKKITLLGSVGQFGMFLGILTGQFYDHMGSRITLITGSLLSAILYFVLYLQFSLQISSTPASVIATYFFANVGNSFRVASAVAVCIKNFPVSQRAKMVGLGKGYFAVGSSIYSQMYLALFRGHVDTFFLFLIFETLIFMIICYPYYVDIPYGSENLPTDSVSVEKKEKAISKQIRSWYVLTFTFVFCLTCFSFCQQYIKYGTWNRIVCSIGIALIISAMIYLANVKPHVELELTNLEPTVPAPASVKTEFCKIETPKPNDLATPKEGKLGAAEPLTKNEVPITMACRTARFWILWFTFFFLCGCALVLINNVAQIKYSLNKAKNAYLEVTIIGVGSLVGRMVLGILSDHYRDTIPREKFVMGCAGVTMCAMVLLLIGNSALLLLACILTSLAYGGIFCLVPALTVDYWGPKHYAGNYGAIDLAPGLGTFIFATFIVGIFYKDVYVGKTVKNCYGRSCYDGTFIICLISAGLGLVLSFVLYKIRPVKKL